MSRAKAFRERGGKRRRRAQRAAGERSSIGLDCAAWTAAQLPNLLSGLRLALVPALLALAWTGHPIAFLCLFAFSLSTDLVDGFLARRWKASSEVGAKLDSWGDLATYAVFPLCAWWLFRDKVLAQLGFVLAALIAFVAPTLVGLAKFRRITSYHTRAAKRSRS